MGSEVPQIGLGKTKFTLRKSEHPVPLSLGKGRAEMGSEAQQAGVWEEVGLQSDSSLPLGSGVRL